MGGRNSIRYVLKNSLPYTKTTCNETISELHYCPVKFEKMDIGDAILLVHPLLKTAN